VEGAAPMDGLDKLLSYIANELDANALREAQLDAAYEYSSVPLCVIDAVFSLGVNWNSTRNTVCKWCEKHQWSKSRFDPGGEEHTVSEFIATMAPYSDDFDRMARDLFENSQRTSATSGIRKAEAVYRFARVLETFGIETLSDAMAQTTDIARRSQIKSRVRAIRGQASGLSHSYFLILIGHEDVVKPDRMIRRFVGKALAVPVSKVTPERAEQLVIRACGRLTSVYPKLTPRVLDNLIWKAERANAGSNQASRHSLPGRIASMRAAGISN
jgi:hypothetical protein